MHKIIKVIKPIIELSMIQSFCQRTQTNEMKYFKVLTQEFSVKIDIAFINAISAFLMDKVNKISLIKLFQNLFFF